MLYQLSYARVFADGTLREMPAGVQGLFFGGGENVHFRDTKISTAPRGDAAGEKMTCPRMPLRVLFAPHPVDE